MAAGLTRDFVASRHLTPDETATDGAVENAKNAAFREALAAAQETGPLPEDHAILPEISPDGEGGTLITVTVRLPL